MTIGELRTLIRNLPKEADIEISLKNGNGTRPGKIVEGKRINAIFSDKKTLKLTIDIYDDPFD